MLEGTSPNLFQEFGDPMEVNGGFLFFSAMVLLTGGILGYWGNLGLM